MDSESRRERVRRSASRAANRLRYLAGGAVQCLADFLIEDVCVLCRRPDPDPAPGLHRYSQPLTRMVASRYLRWFAVHNHPVCGRCADTFAVARGPGTLGRATCPGSVHLVGGELFRGRPLAMLGDRGSRRIGVVAPFMTNDAALALVRAVKFLGYRDLLDPIAEVIVRAMGDMRPGLTARRHALVPVPMARRQQRWRGFNQAELLASRIADRTGIPLYRNLLVKTANTHPQSGTAHAARAANVRGAFRVTRELAGSRILLVDDLVTTGATAGACAAEIWAAGARSLDVLCFARSV